MKKCPTCNRTYSDETLSFCLGDGALLSPSYDADETLVMSEVPTVVQAERQTGASKPDQQRGSNAPLTYIMIALLALLIGGGFVGIFLYRGDNSNVSGTSNGSNKQESKSSPIPTATPTLRFTLQDALRTYQFEQGWSGGRANGEYSSNITYYPVTNTTVNGEDVVMNYAWKDGVLRLTITGNELKGTWHQSNASGPITLRFTDDFQNATGTWSDGTSGESGAAFLRRSQSSGNGTKNAPTVKQMQDDINKEVKKMVDDANR